MIEREVWEVYPEVDEWEVAKPGDSDCEDRREAKIPVYWLERFAQQIEAGRSPSYLAEKIRQASEGCEEDQS